MRQDDPEVSSEWPGGSWCLCWGLRFQEEEQSLREETVGSMLELLVTLAISRRRFSWQLEILI